MAYPGLMEPFSERREQWRRLDRHWRDSLAEANGKRDSSALEVKSLDELKSTLQNFHTDDTAHESDKQPPVSEILSPAFESLLPLVRAINLASHYQQAAELIWGGVISVIEGASKASFVPYTVTTLIIDLSESIQLVDPEDKTIYRYKAVQYALQDFFDDFLGYCAHACSYYSRPAYTDVLGRVFSRGPRGTLEFVRDRMNRHNAKLRDAVISEMRLQEAKIASLVPPGISDMPQQKDNRKDEAKVEFPVSTIDRSRNSAFIGRDDVLLELTDKIGVSKQSGDDQDSTILHTPTTKSALSTDQAAYPPTVCVLCGLGGVGKTQIALEYYYEHRGDYDACFWVEAEHDWTLASTFAKIADKLELLPQKTTANGGNELQSKAVEEGRAWLQNTDRRWLLIFDNVESFSDLGRYLPTECRSNGTIIITTQAPTVPAWIENVRIVGVKTLELENAAMCIFKYLDREPNDDDERAVALQLAEFVGCMPLAMATIGGYVKQSQMSLEDFFNNIKHKATLWKIAPQIEEAQHYEKSLITVFNKAFKDLTLPARELLNVLAFLDPDSIPETLFTNAIKKELFKHIRSKGDLLECYFELRSRQLIRRDTSNEDSYLSIHRVVQWNVLLNLSEDYEKRWDCFKQAFDIVKEVLPNPNPLQTPEPEAWPPYAKHGRQILELRTHCLWPEPPVKLPRSFAQILADMGTFMWFSGKFPEGGQALRTAWQILDDNRRPEGDMIRTNVYSMLGIITSYEGVSVRRESMGLRRKAYLSRNESSIGLKTESERTREEDIMLWQMHSDMAYGFIQEEDFRQTARYMEECLEQYKKWEADEMAIPFEYSKYYMLISYCHMEDQQPLKSIQAITRCLELINAAAGEEHPMALLIKFCHANLLWHTNFPGMRGEALKINKAVLEYRRKLLGEFSVFTLESYSTCGKLCYDAGEIEKAREYLETCLERRKRAAWNEEGVTRAQFRYSKVLRELANQANNSQSQDDRKSLEAVQLYTSKAEAREEEVVRVIERYRENYAKYLPKTDDQEANLDQMVSIWAGRFTGGLKRASITAADAEVPWSEYHD